MAGTLPRFFLEFTTLFDNYIRICQLVRRNFNGAFCKTPELELVLSQGQAFLVLFSTLNAFSCRNPSGTVSLCTAPCALLPGDQLGIIAFLGVGPVCHRVEVQMLDSFSLFLQLFEY